MTKITQDTSEDIARYFGFSTILVEDAITHGCETYQDVYDFCKREMTKMERL